MSFARAFRPIGCRWSRATAASIVAVIALGPTACGSRPAPKTAPRPSLLDAVSNTPPKSRPAGAEWHFHPREPAPIYAQTTLPDGRVLSAAGRGQRWLVDVKRARAETASDLAPEDLVAISRSANGWSFLGRSGATYFAAAPLAAFERSTSPLEPLVRIRPAGNGFIGIRRDGTLVRRDSDDATLQSTGPAGVKFEDVAVLPDGRGLALSIPEAFFETRDFGASFTRLAVPTFGAEGFVVDAARLMVESPLGPRVWSPDGSTPFLSFSHMTKVATYSLGVPVPLGPTAPALLEGRAAIVGGTWVEARPTSDGFQFVKGVLGGAFEASPLPAARGCAGVRLSGFGSTLYLLCSRQRPANVTQSIDVRRSQDFGQTWQIEPYVVDGQVASLEMAVTDTGDLVVSGVCPAAERAPGCRPEGVQIQRVVAGDAGPRATLEPAQIPSLSGTPLALAASLDGRVIYAIGTRSKSESLAVFVSHDGGATFEARPVAGADVPNAEDTRRHGANPIEGVAAAEDGTLSIVLNARRGRMLLVVDDDGQTVALAKPPVATAKIGAVGQRAIAVEPSETEAWESLDAGASWAPLGKLRFPVDSCTGGAKRCPLTLACAAGGCVFGTSVTRVGWGETSRSPLLPNEGAHDKARRATPRVGVTLSCTFDRGGWRKVEGALSLPSASEAALGKLAWFAPRADVRTASVSVYRASLGAKPTFDDVTLLAPEKRAEEFAFYLAPQIEGVAALRYPIPGLRGSRDPTLGPVEVAWDNVLFDTVRHATIPDGGAYRAGDYDTRRGGARIAKPALLSIASGGIYTRLHASLGDDQPTYFLDGRTTEVVPPVVWPDGARRLGSPEMLHVGKAHVALRFGSTLLRATRGAIGWSFDGMTFGFVRPRDRGVQEHVDIAYAGDRAGIVIDTGTDSLHGARAALYPMRASGAVADEPILVPTQQDLPLTPRSCTAVDQRATPRIVAPFHPGTRHPVLLTDPIEPMRVLLTDNAVLHGTPHEPCVSAYDAELVSTEAGGTPSEQALIFLGPHEHSYLFRSDEKAGEGLEFRSMTCRPDPAAEAPIEVFRERGTLVDKE